MLKMKSTTYIAEITTQKNEKKYLSERRKPLASLPGCLPVLCQQRNFLCEFTEKCFDQSSCTIYLFFNWDSLHPRLNSHYEAWSYKKKKHKKIIAYRKSV